MHESMPPKAAERVNPQGSISAKAEVRSLKNLLLLSCYKQSGECRGLSLILLFTDECRMNDMPRFSPLERTWISRYICTLVTVCFNSPNTNLLIHHKDKKRCLIS